jgi:hypothetical protein
MSFPSERRRRTLTVDYLVAGGVNFGFHATNQLAFDVPSQLLSPVRFRRNNVSDSTFGISRFFPI